MVGHERVELLDVGDDVVHAQRRELLAPVRARPCGLGADVAEEVQHEPPHAGGVISQPRRRGGRLVGDPVGEYLQAGPAGARRGPGQVPGLQGDPEVPLGAVPQPERLKLVEVEAVVALRFMGPSRMRGSSAGSHTSRCHQGRWS